MTGRSSVTTQSCKLKYTISVKNIYQALDEASNGKKYLKYVEANREAMEELLPKRTKANKLLRSSDVRVSAARQEAQVVQNHYEASGLAEDKDLCRQALKHLYEMYTQVGEVEMVTKIQTIEELHGAQKYGEV